MKPTPYLSFVLVLLAGLLFAAQALALDPARSIAQYTHTKWTIADGAPSGIISIVQSTDGYLWMAASTGLYRFDGLTFERIPPIEGDDSRSERITALLALPSGDILVGYFYGGIAIYHDGKLRDFNHGPPAGMVVGLAQDADGGIWVGTTGRSPIGLSRYLNGKWQTFDADSGVPLENFEGILGTPDGAVWVVTEGSVLVLRRGSDRFERVGDRPNVVAQDGFLVNVVGLATDALGRGWISDCGGVRLLHGTPVAEKGSIPPGLCPRGGAIPQRIIFDRDGGIWGATPTDGIARLLPEGADKGFTPGSGDRFRATDGMSSNATDGIMEDREGNIWIGTSSGLDRFRAANIVVETAFPPPTDANYLAARDAAGTIDVVAGNKFYQILPGANPVASPHTFPGVASLFCASPNGRVFIITKSKDFIELHGDDFQSLASSVIPPSWMLSACSVDKLGTLWLSVPQQGLYRFDGNKLMRFAALPDAPNHWPETMGFDPQGRLLLFFGRRSLVRVSGGQTETVMAPHENKIGLIGVIAPSARYTLLGGEKGLSELIDGQIRTLTASQYPWLSHVSGITQNGRGETWLIGSDSIIRLVTADLEQAFEDPARPLPYEIFDVNDGLPNFAGIGGLNNIKTNNLEGSDGRIWFTVTDHLVWVDPAHLARNPLPPPVSIQRLVANDKPYALPLIGALPKGVSKIEIDYTALSLTFPQRNRFRYRLDGIDDDWVDPGSRRQAFYANLGPGHYRFTVIAANNDGVWNKTGATLAFDIPPTFVQSKLFLALCIPLALALLWLLYSLRLRQMAGRIRGRLEERLAERERIARELHDTLLQGFQGLLLRLQAVADQIPPEQPTHGMMEQALDRAEDVLVEGRDRVRNLRATQAAGDLSRMLGDAAERLELGPDVSVRVVVEGARRDLHPAIYDEIVAIGKEALFNISCHAKAKTVEIGIGYGRKQLMIRFSDDGVGIDQATLEQGRDGHFGLMGMRERAAKIRASFVINSRIGAGTEIELVVPSNVAYARNGKSIWPWPLRQPEPGDPR